MLLRSQDQLRLFERHPTDHRILEAYLGGVRGAEVKDTDGFEGLKGQVPPSSRRAVVRMLPIASEPAPGSVNPSAPVLLPSQNAADKAMIATLSRSEFVM
jgi:hypothetical protein